MRDPNNLRTFLILCAVTLPTFLVIDFVWIGILAKSFYANQIGFLMKRTPNWAASLLFYILYVVGLVYFVLLPTVASAGWTDAFLRGGVIRPGRLRYLRPYQSGNLKSLATAGDGG